VVAETHEAVERIAVGVRNEVAAVAVCDVLCLAPGVHKATGNLPAAGELKSDVDLGAGCCCHDTDVTSHP
jgi:hypothetical protein